MSVAVQALAPPVGLLAVTMVFPAATAHRPGMHETPPLYPAPLAVHGPPPWDTSTLPPVIMHSPLDAQEAPACPMPTDCAVQADVDEFEGATEIAA
jgi:hypothetical protein